MDQTQQTSICDSSSELVVPTGCGGQQSELTEASAINLPIETIGEEFSTIFTKRETKHHSHYTAVVPVQYIPHSDVLYFVHPTEDQSSTCDQLHDDRGVIYPPSFDTVTSTPVQDHALQSNENSVVHIDDVLQVSKNEVFELHPPDTLYKVNFIVL